LRCHNFVQKQPFAAILRGRVGQSPSNLGLFLLRAFKGRFRFLDLRRLFFFLCTLQIQGQQPFQNLLVGQVGGPAAGGGGMEFLVGEVQPCVALVVKVGECALPGRLACLGFRTASSCHGTIYAPQHGHPHCGFQEDNGRLVRN